MYLKLIPQINLAKCASEYLILSFIKKLIQVTFAISALPNTETFLCNRMFLLMIKTKHFFI
jgi:hypothetical protein